MLFVECAQREIMLKVVQMAYCCTIMHIKQYSACGISHFIEGKEGMYQSKKLRVGLISNNFSDRRTELSFLSQNKSKTY